MQRRLALEEELSKEIPSRFRQLKKSLFSCGSGNEPSAHSDSGDIGLFVVYTGNRSWTPEELRQRAQVSISLIRDDTDKSWLGLLDPNTLRSVR